MAGLRVIRGPDWKYGNQDGGDGHLATIEVCLGVTVCVIWDNGTKGVKHPDVTCEACEKKNIHGLRWKCLDCNNCDLCTVCYGNDRHDKNHAFKRIDKPGKDGLTVDKRSSYEKTQARGIYPGATVVRGQDWNKDNEDGGDGNTGVLLEVGYASGLEGDIAICVVVWQNDSTRRVYRLGVGGNVDVKCTTPAIGLSFYRKHLPVLRDVSEVCNENEIGIAAGIGGAVAAMAACDGLLSRVLHSPQLLSQALISGGLGIGMNIHSTQDDTNGATEKFKVGDLVRLCNNLERLTRLQDGHGGFKPEMKGALNQVGVIGSINRRDLLVHFGGNLWSMNPEAVTKVTIDSEDNKPPPSCKIGDKLILNKSVSVTKELQAGHGGWNTFMEQLIQKKRPGTVKDIDSDGDIHVDFGHDVIFLLNPATCGKAPHKDVNAGVKTPLDNLD